jgi:phospholipid/cholesterol/gamma-HCH transport system substrate-binding protein
MNGYVHFSNKKYIMKNEKSKKIRLGLFVLIGLGLLLAGVYFIGQRQKLFSSTFRVRSVFKDINGLQTGNNVRFSGINVGIVDAIYQVSDSSVQVEMKIDNDTKEFIKKNATATIGTDGLMGNKIIIILPGKAGEKVIEDNDRIKSIQPVQMDDLLTSIKTTSDNAALITSDLAAITENIRKGRGTIGKLFMDTAFATDIDQTVTNIKQGAQGFQQNMDAAKKNILLRGYFKKKDKKNTDNKK